MGWTSLSAIGHEKMDKSSTAMKQTAASIALPLPTLRPGESTELGDGVLDRRPIRRRRVWRWKVVAAVLLAGLGTLLAEQMGWTWTLAVSHAARGGEAQISRTQLQFATVEQGAFSHDIDVEARTVAGASPTLFAPQTGIVTLHVAEGDTVEKGAIVAVMESPALRSQLARERSELAALRSTHARSQLLARSQALQTEKLVALSALRKEHAMRLHEREQTLSSKGLIAAQALETSLEAAKTAALELEFQKRESSLAVDAAEFEVDNARRRVERQSLLVDDLERQVSELRLTAPFSGIVASLSAKNSDMVVQGQALIGMVDLADLELALELPENLSDEVFVGTPIESTVDGEAVSGKVVRIAPEVVEGRIIARARLDDERAALLRQNQRVRTRVVLSAKGNVLKIVRGPYLQNGGGRLVYVRRGDTLVAREIELGVVGVSAVEVLRGLSEGEQIVLNDLGEYASAEVIHLR